MIGVGALAKMPEQELNPAATKFISSLVRSLQILCNGQVEFNESIELVGHINVKIDHIYKFDYIVDEQVSKEGEDSSTTFLSNSYHSCRPTKQTHKKANPAELEQDVIFSEIPTDSQRRLKQMKNMHELENQPESTALQRENSHQNYSVSVDKHCNEPNQMVVKLEGGEDSNDCMVLPASPVDYEGEANRTESYSVPGPSSSFDESNGNQAILTRKRRKASNQRTEETERQIDMSPEVTEDRTAPARVMYGCITCLMKSPSPIAYQAHKRYCEQPCFTCCCSVCNYKAESPETITIHISLVHVDVSQLIACTECGSHFKTQTGLKKHMEVKHRTNPTLKCPICGKVMYNKINLDGHVNKHKGLKPHVCLYCGKTFSYKQSLCAHEKLCTKSPRILGSGAI